MKSNSCPRAEVRSDYCECCVEEGKNNVRKFRWDILYRAGHFCSEGHFWAEPTPTPTPTPAPPTWEIDYGVDPGRRKW